MTITQVLETLLTVCLAVFALYDGGINLRSALKNGSIRGLYQTKFKLHGNMPTYLLIFAFRIFEFMAGVALIVSVVLGRDLIISDILQVAK